MRVGRGIQASKRGIGGSCVRPRDKDGVELTMRGATIRCINDGEIDGSNNRKGWRYDAVHSVPDSRLARRRFENDDTIDLPIELAIMAGSE